MTAEELMQPRYKVIASYPGCPYKLGHIVRLHTHTNEVVEEQVQFFGSYPHLFKKLKWWEDRKVDDMPKFLSYKNRDIGQTIIAKVDGYNYNHWEEFYAITEASFTGKLLIKNSGAQPATEEEYNAYKQSTK